MRGDNSQPVPMFSDLSPEERVPQNHPLRAIQVLVDAVLKELSSQFDLFVFSYWPAVDGSGGAVASALQVH
jgi:hypothetical protein